MPANPARVPRPSFVPTEEIYRLWHRIAAFPAAETEGALHELMQWLVTAIHADNVIWIGAVRSLRGVAAKDDPFFGWRLRVRQTFKPETSYYRRILARYYGPDHYGKLTSSYYVRSHDPKRDAHVGMTGRGSLAGAGRFRVHRLRDGDWIDFAAFKRTPHYRLYYRGDNIVDRMTIGLPVAEDAESFLLIDRRRTPASPRPRPFNSREASLAGGVVRGVPELHRRLLLMHGLLCGDKPLSPTERQILNCLLTGLAEKEIAARAGQKPATLHKYVTQLYTRFRVQSRPALMALWLGAFAAR